MERSDPNDISGDVPLNDRQKLLWYTRNVALYHAEEIALDRVFNFRVADLSYPGPVCKARQTVSRVLSNLFWLNLPAEKIRAELGKIRLLDIGCGSGRYFHLLDRKLGGVEAYTGVDIRRNPAFDAVADDPRVSFIESPAEELDPSVIAASNFIYSQSAIEHVAYDLSCFDRIAEATRKKTEPTLQIHLLPPAQMFRQWGPHGFRGYNSRGIKAIADRFADFSEVTLYTLGGPRCIETHCEYIFDCFDSGKRDRRKWWKSRYVAAVKAAIRADMAEEKIAVKEACFLALVIHSYPRREIFERDTFAA